MRHYLIDTHTALWFFNGDNAISSAADKIIRDRTNRIYLSVISAWELGPVRFFV